MQYNMIKEAHRKDRKRMMRGIDISHHNGWPLNAPTESAYKESDFVIVKATQGTYYSDTAFFYKAVDKVLADGKLAGAYHYAKGYDAVKEADYFIETVKKYLGKIILALDWETSADPAGKNYAWGSTTWAKTFADRVYDKTGVRCFLYTGNDGVRQCKNMYIQYPLWFAGYPTLNATWDIPRWPAHYHTEPWQTYTIWQFTSSHYLVDRNVSYLTLAGWDYYAKSTNGKVKPAVQVKVGSARIDENGNAHGGKAGDQTGKEVAIENWYKHNLGWTVVRARSAQVREKIAQDMEYACNNPNIGYDQYQNQTLWQEASRVGWNCSKIYTPCETDCARLVRVCVRYAGIYAEDFYTGNEVEKLKATGQFDILTDKKYTDSSEYLLRGDILVTKTKGHTVVVLNDGLEEPQPKKKGREEDMQCLFTVDGKNPDTPYWFDGQKIHTLSHKDQAEVLKRIYKDNNGKDMPFYKWVSTAPWYIRLDQATKGPEPTKW